MSGINAIIRNAKESMKGDLTFEKWRGVHIKLGPLTKGKLSSKQAARAFSILAEGNHRTANTWGAARTYGKVLDNDPTEDQTFFAEEFLFDFTEEVEQYKKKVSDFEKDDAPADMTNKLLSMQKVLAKAN